MKFLDLQQVLQRRFYEISTPVMRFLLVYASKQIPFVSSLRPAVLFVEHCYLTDNSAILKQTEIIHLMTEKYIIYPIDDCNCVTKEYMKFIYLDDCMKLDFKFRNLPTVLPCATWTASSVYITAVPEDLFVSPKNFETLLKALVRLPNLNSIRAGYVEFPVEWQSTFIKYMADRLWERIQIYFPYDTKCRVNFNAELSEFISKQKYWIQFSVHTTNQDDYSFEETNYFKFFELTPTLFEELDGLHLYPCLELQANGDWLKVCFPKNQPETISFA